MSTRIIQTVSETELNRRRRSVIELMREKSLDLLLIAAYSRWNGYLRYLTNYLAVSTFPEYLIVSIDGNLTFIGHYKHQADFMRTVFGVEECCSVPTNPTRSYALDAAFVSDLIGKRRPGSLGLVGPDTISAAFYNRLVKENPQLNIQDATDIVSEVRKVKSDEEIRLIEKTAAITDMAIETCLKAAQPGRREDEVMVEVANTIRQAGCEEVSYHFGSAPAGSPTPAYRCNAWNRVLRDKDVLRITIEPAGPGGYYSEMGRILCLGHIPSELQDPLKTVIQAQREAAKMLKPGVAFSDIFKRCNEIISEAGYPPTGSLHGHSQGLDLVEKPFVHPDETSKVSKSMNVTIHPKTYGKKGVGYLCDNYIVTEGGARRLHKAPQEALIA